MKGGGGEVEERSWLGAREEELARCPEERENKEGRGRLWERETGQRDGARRGEK